MHAKYMYKMKNSNQKKMQTDAWLLSSCSYDDGKNGLLEFALADFKPRTFCLFRALIKTLFSEL